MEHAEKACSWNGNILSCVLNYFAGCIMLIPINISLLCLAFFRYLKAKALRWHKIALGDWVWKNRWFSKTVKNSKKAKHSFVDAFITHCPKPLRFNNSQQKVLPFCFKTFYCFSNSVGVTWQHLLNWKTPNWYIHTSF